MHAEAYTFLRSALTPERVSGARILELGSYNVNGTARDFCAAAAAYVGVDRRPGPGVDVVDPNDSFDGQGQFDIVISSETLEHADDPAGLVASARRALRPGGAFIVTAAGPGRAPHCCDGHPNHGQEFYQAISLELLTGLLADWSDVEVQYGASHGHAQGDIYAIAHTPAASGGTFITSGPADLIVGCDGSTEGCLSCDAIRERLGRPMTDAEIAEACGRPIRATVEPQARRRRKARNP